MKAKCLAAGPQSLVTARHVAGEAPYFCAMCSAISWPSGPIRGLSSNGWKWISAVMSSIRAKAACSDFRPTTHQGQDTSDTKSIFMKPRPYTHLRQHETPTVTRFKPAPGPRHAASIKLKLIRRLPYRPARPGLRAPGYAPRATRPGPTPQWLPVTRDAQLVIALQQPRRRP